jgi:hypothetical protein
VAQPTWAEVAMVLTCVVEHMVAAVLALGDGRMSTSYVMEV